VINFVDSDVKFIYVLSFSSTILFWNGGTWIINIVFIFDNSHMW